MPARAKLHPLFLLAGVFAVLAPASVASGLSFSEPTKYARLLTTLMIVFWGLANGRGFRLGPAGVAFVVFLVVFGGAGAWSTTPHYALFYKGMFTLSAISGLVLVNSLRSEEELKRGFRLLGLVSGAATCVALGVYWYDPASSTRMGRMDILGMNANMLGQTAAALFILCLSVALNRPSKLVRFLMLSACAALGLMIIGTGSRASVLMALSGMLILMLPLVRRPAMVATIALGGMLTLYLAFEIMDLSGGNRLVANMSKNTRADVWHYGLRLFSKSPIIGIGWFQFERRQANLHSAYVQVLVESGILGATALLTALAVMIYCWCRNQRRLGRLGRSRELSYLAAALLFPVLIHGLAESATFIAAGLNALFLGMGVGLLDRTLSWSEGAQKSRRRQPSQRLPEIGWRSLPDWPSGERPAWRPVGLSIPPERQN